MFVYVRARLASRFYPIFFKFCIHIHLFYKSLIKFINQNMKTEAWFLRFLSILGDMAKVH